MENRVSDNQANGNLAGNKQKDNSQAGKKQGNRKPESDNQTSKKLTKNRQTSEDQANQKQTKDEPKGKKEKNHERIERIIAIYTKLRCGLVVKKAEEIDYYDVTEKTIQRDIVAIRECLDVVALQEGIYYTIDFDQAKKGYRMQGTKEGLFSGAEGFVLGKMILASNMFSKAKAEQLLEKLLRFCPAMEREKVKKLLQNECHHYVGTDREDAFWERLWELAQVAQNQKLIALEYRDKKGKTVTLQGLRTVEVICSGNSFFLVTFRAKGKRKTLPGVGEIPEFYPFDQIVQWEVLEEEKYAVKRERFEVGDFRRKFQAFLEKRIPKVIEMQCLKADAQFLVENFPTAKIVSEENGKCTVCMERDGKGLDWWLGR